MTLDIVTSNRVRDLAPLVVGPSAIKPRGASWLYVRGG